MNAPKMRFTKWLCKSRQIFYFSVQRLNDIKYIIAQIIDTNGLRSSCADQNALHVLPMFVLLSFNGYSNACLSILVAIRAACGSLHLARRPAPCATFCSLRL